MRPSFGSPPGVPAIQERLTTKKTRWGAPPNLPRTLTQFDLLKAPQGRKPTSAPRAQPGLGRKPLRKRGWWLFLATTATCALGVKLFQSHAPLPRAHHQEAPTSLEQFLSPQPPQVADLDIALENLLCAEGLSGAADLNVQECLTTLDQWAAHLKTETERNLHRYREGPAAYTHS